MNSRTQSSLLYLWDRRTLYLGQIFEPLDLTQAAATLVLGLQKPLTFNDGDEGPLLSSRCILLPAGSSVRIDAREGLIACCHLDPLGIDYTGLKILMKRCEQGIFFDSDLQNQFIDYFKGMFKTRGSSETAYHQLDEFFCRHTTQNWPEIDPRIEKVIALVKSSIDDSLSVEELAKSVNLSVPRLVQLFKSQTGVTIRRYRLWHRLFLTAVRLGNGENLTHAAQGAGFTDSAHCCHTFRAILGMKPTLLLNQPNGIDIVSPREELRDLSA